MCLYFTENPSFILCVEVHSRANRGSFKRLEKERNLISLSFWVCFTSHPRVPETKDKQKNSRYLTSSGVPSGGGCWPNTDHVSQKRHRPLPSEGDKGETSVRPTLSCDLLRSTEARCKLQLKCLRTTISVPHSWCWKQPPLFNCSCLLWTWMGGTLFKW